MVKKTDTKTEETTGVPAVQETQALSTTVTAQVPAFMRDDAGDGLKDAAQYIVPPRLKLIQPLSGAPYDVFNPGDVVAVPQNILVAEMPYEGPKATNKGTPLFFIPVFFYAEWCTWNDILLKGTEDPIAYRTTDPEDPVAQKAKVANLREEEYPDGREVDGKRLHMRHVEHLNYVIVLCGDHPLAGQPMALSFFRGEHKQGSALALMANMRNAPLYGCVFQARAGFRKNVKGQWYGLDISNPPEDSGVAPFVTDEEQFGRLKELAHTLRDAHAKSQLQFNYEDEQTVEPGDSASTDF